MSNPRSSHHWKHHDQMFVWSALACLAVCVLGALLLRYALTAAVALIAAMAGAFGLATPIIAVLIFAASIATSIWHKHKKVVLDDEPETSAADARN